MAIAHRSMFLLLYSANALRKASVRFYYKTAADLNMYCIKTVVYAAIA